MLLSETSTLDLMDEDDCIALDQYITQAARRVIANANKHDVEDDFTIGNAPSVNEIIDSLQSQAYKMLDAGVSLKKVLQKLQNVG